MDDRANAKRFQLVDRRSDRESIEVMMEQGELYGFQLVDRRSDRERKKRIEKIFTDLSFQLVDRRSDRESVYSSFVSTPSAMFPISRSPKRP